jgi:hypothetical protein
VLVVNRLHHAAQPEGQPYQAKLGLYPRVNVHRKTLVGADAASAQAQVENTTLQPRCNIDEKNHRRGIDCFPQCLAPVAADGLGLRRNADLRLFCRFH